MQAPASISDLIIPEEYTKTFSGKSFLLYDSGDDEKRFLLFTTDKNLEYLSTCKIWHCDGTFNTVPLILKQLYIIHGVKNNKTNPLIFISLPSKDTSIYKKVLVKIEEPENNLNPEQIITDAEKASINAVGVEFPQAHIHGYRFHLGPIYTHIQQSGNQLRDRIDKEFSLNIRILLALAFVPIDNVKFTYKQQIRILSTKF